MTSNNIKQASLQEIRRMRGEGQLVVSHDNATHEDLATDFWADAVVVDAPSQARSVRLNLDPEVFAFFKDQGKGHITRMQNVLKAYAEHHMRRTGR